MAPSIYGKNLLGGRRMSGTISCQQILLSKKVGYPNFQKNSAFDSTPGHPRSDIEQSSTEQVFLCWVPAVELVPLCVCQFLAAHAIYHFLNLTLAELPVFKLQRGVLDKNTDMYQNGCMMDVKRMHK